MQINIKEISGLAAASKTMPRRCTMPRRIQFRRCVSIVYSKITLDMKNVFQSWLWVSCWIEDEVWRVFITVSWCVGFLKTCSNSYHSRLPLGSRWTSCTVLFTDSVKGWTLPVDDINNTLYVMEPTTWF